MIRKPTVVVLGAGASIDYKLPSSSKLREDIVNSISPTSNRSAEISKWIGVEAAQLRDFAHQLRNSRTETIDSWLAANPKFMDLGKTAICKVIGQHEHAGFLYGGWCQDIWNIMKEGARDIDTFTKNNRLFFVTFNYDRSLEEFFYQSIKNYFLDANEDMVIKAVKVINITHVHGQNGYLPWQIEDKIKQATRAYVPHKDFDAESWKQAKSCSKHILTTYDTSDGLPDVFKLGNIMANARKILFAGFGYDPSNLRKLLINNDDVLEIFGMYHSTTFRSKQSISNSDQNGFKQGIQLVPEDSISQFLRNHLDF